MALCYRQTVKASKSSAWKSRCAAFGLVLAGVMSVPAAAQEGGDLQAQITYAYQTEDLGRLRSLRQSLADQVRGEHATTAARYHLAHADYRLGLLLRSRRQAAAQPLQECASQLSELDQGEAVSAEVLALQAICWMELAGERKLQAVFLRSRAVEALQRAARADARNPRVKLGQALQQLAVAGDAGPVPPELERAAELFEHSPATNEEAPGWGHAECYLLMGHALRVRGDELGARNWLEKALIIAPDYKAAQAEIAQLNR